MRKLGKIEEIFSSTKENNSKIRPIVKKLIMIKNHGIKNDKFAQKNTNKEVMLISKEAYSIAKKHSIILKMGSLGENILLDFNPQELKVGSILIIDEVQLLLTQACTICKHLSVYNENLPKLLAYNRGIYCKILNNGFIEKNASVFVKDES